MRRQAAMVEKEIDVETPDMPLSGKEKRGNPTSDNHQAVLILAQDIRKFQQDASGGFDLNGGIIDPALRLAHHHFFPIAPSKTA
jgi:hypothetical protein